MGQSTGHSSGTGYRHGDPTDPDVTRPLVSDAGGFDGYDLDDVALGDLMRGERATLGKSLLDVERELKIRAAYIAAIENGDIGAFASPGFIAGYVRSYARYLGIEPEWCFRRFCDETGFQGVHGRAGRAATSQAAPRTPPAFPPMRMDPNEVMKSARIDFAPARENPFANIEPGALGSALVLIGLVVGLGYGAWAVLHDIQRLQIAPVDEAPAPLAQLDPLAGATEGAFDVAQNFDIAVPGADTFDRLYRPQALEVPVLTPRDGALATLDPDEVGTLGGLNTAPREAPALNLAAVDTTAGTVGTAAPAETPVQVTAASGTDEVVLFAVRPSWIRVTSASGTTLFEGTLNAGDSYTLPPSETPPLLRAGNSGSLYFAINGVALGPAGPGVSIASDVELSADAIFAAYPMADGSLDPDLPEVAALVIDSADAR